VTGPQRLTGRIRVAQPPAEAFRLFTARGEQDWAPGWYPHFPVPAPDDTEPGTVFETGARAVGGGPSLAGRVRRRLPGLPAVLAGRHQRLAGDGGLIRLRAWAGRSEAGASSQLMRGSRRNQDS
jgi:hypothetical protein